jgi:pimeloyl-ACP methyl ester carboxylesterase
VHGSAQGSEVGGDRHFSAQERLASRGGQLIVPDRPGHGRSPAPGRPDDAEADGEWVADLLGAGAHLVGHSFGGCVALAAVARRPSAVHSLTLIEPAMQKLATSDPRVRRLVLRMVMVLAFSWSAASRAKRFAKLVGVPPEIRGGASPEELERMGKSLSRMKIPSKETLQRQLSDIERAEIPLLVVTGGWNPAFEATADRVASVGNGRRTVIKSDHHLPQLVSDEFNQVLVTFMEESDARRAARLQGLRQSPGATSKFVTKSAGTFGPHT